jgi:hypothetical protein
MTVWRRNSLVTYQAIAGSNWEDAIGPGNTYLRYHIRWGIQLDTPLGTDIQNLSTALFYFGLVTTIGNGTETPPGARSDAWPDVAPPLERWVYWETVAPVLELVSVEAGIMVWRGAASTEVTSSKGQVANTGTPEGETLNLWTSWDCAQDLGDPTFGNFMHWHSISILRKNDL